jgi:hypothetical protein
MKKFVFSLMFFFLSNLITQAIPITIRYTTPDGCEYQLQLDVYWTGDGGFHGWHGVGTFTSICCIDNSDCLQGHGIIVFKPDVPENNDNVITITLIGSSNLCAASNLMFSSNRFEYMKITDFLNSQSINVLNKIKREISCKQ